MRRPLASKFLVVALTACASAVTAQIADPRNGCIVHNPNPKPGESITWSGGCQDGLAHGTRTIAWFLDGEPNGRFEDVLTNGRIVGEGTNHYASGSRYSGRFLDGIPEGPGTFYFTDGRRYVGTWRSGKPDGAGVLFSPDGKATPQTWKKGARVN